MRMGGTEMPRRKVDVGGWFVICAQSRGECPGFSTTFFDGRAEGARVDEETARLVGFEAPTQRDGGMRRLEAVDGGGLRELGFFGSGRSLLDGDIEGARRLEEAWDDFN